MISTETSADAGVKKIEREKNIYSVFISQLQLA